MERCLYLIINTVSSSLEIIIWETYLFCHQVMLSISEPLISLLKEDWHKLIFNTMYPICLSWRNKLFFRLVSSMLFFSFLNFIFSIHYKRHISLTFNRFSKWVATSCHCLNLYFIPLTFKLELLEKHCKIHLCIKNNLHNLRKFRNNKHVNTVYKLLSGNKKSNCKGNVQKICTLTRKKSKWTMEEYFKYNLCKWLTSKWFYHLFQAWEIAAVFILAH